MSVAGADEQAKRSQPQTSGLRVSGNGNECVLCDTSICPSTVVKS
jgi:hypothetical protein